MQPTRTQLVLVEGRGPKSLTPSFLIRGLRGYRVYRV